MATPEPIRDPILERPLPSSPETERAILGAVILDNSLIAQAVELLKPADFYVPSHRRIFVAMIALFERGSEINPILIAEELRRDHQQEGGKPEIEGDKKPTAGEEHPFDQRFDPVHGSADAKGPRYRGPLD